MLAGIILNLNKDDFTSKSVFKEKFSYDIIIDGFRHFFLCFIIILNVREEFGMIIFSS